MTISGNNFKKFTHIIFIEIHMFKNEHCLGKMRTLPIVTFVRLSNFSATAFSRIFCLILPPNIVFKFIMGRKRGHADNGVSFIVF